MLILPVLQREKRLPLPPLPPQILQLFKEWCACLSHKAGCGPVCHQAVHAHLDPLAVALLSQQQP